MKPPLRNILFIDIETVPQYPSYAEAPEIVHKLWSEKTKKARKEKTPEEYYPKAGIWAEFGKIICVGVGYFFQNDDETQFRVKSITGEEQKILEALVEILSPKNTYFSESNHNNPQFQYLCAHNGKEFDFPFIARRLLVHAMELPPQLDMSGKKPWEISHIDTMQLWSFGDYKHHTSLELLAQCMNIESPKTALDGTKIFDCYYKEKGMERIAAYCKKDVITLSKIYLKMKSISMDFNIVDII